MNKLSSRINRLSESATLAMARMSRELKAQGVDVISLSLGEPDFNTPDFIKKAAINAIENNFSHSSTFFLYQFHKHFCFLTLEIVQDFFLLNL